MLCMSCGANIPPEWVKAIQSGVCPGCGEQIMNEATKELLVELTAAMERMPNNPQGIAGWLLSNYQFQKIGDAIPVERFHDKTNMIRANIEKGSDNMSEKLLQRTDVYKRIKETEAKLNKAKNGKNNKLAAMAQAISSGDVDEHMYGSDQPEPQYEEEIEAEFEDDYEEERGPRRSRELITGENIIDPRAAPLSLAEIKSLAGTIKTPDTESSQEEVQRELQLQRFKRVKAQQAVMGGSGAFRRS